MAQLKTHEGNLDASGKRFALIVSRYNEFFASRLLGGAEDCLARHGAAKPLGNDCAPHSPVFGCIQRSLRV